jgi:hypothetical protein
MDQILNKKNNSTKKKHKLFPLPYKLVSDINRKKETKYLSKSQIQSPKL